MPVIRVSKYWLPNGDSQQRDFGFVDNYYIWYCYAIPRIPMEETQDATQ